MQVLHIAKRIEEGKTKCTYLHLSDQHSVFASAWVQLFKALERKSSISTFEWQQLRSSSADASLTAGLVSLMTVTRLVHVFSI